MANRDYTSVLYTLEKSVVFLSARAVFDANGVAVLDAVNSKGVCGFGLQSVSLTGATTNSSSTVGTVSSLSGLYTGMTVTDSAAGLAAATTINSVSATTNTIVLNKQAITTNASDTLFASGGRYVVQFGSQLGVKLDPYYKLMFVHHTFHETTASASGSATSSALAPAAPSMFVVSNNTRQRTIPGTATSNSTDCSLSVQFGTGVGTSFVAGNPAAGEAVHFLFVFGNSSAM